MAYHLRGSYLESCNCDPICPCRTVDGRGGGRSTHGICEGALSWSIAEGDADGVELDGLGVILALRYSDDEEGSPWTFWLYVDERGNADQQRALADIFSGNLGGSTVEHFPWVWKPSKLLGVEPARIELDHTPGRGWFRAGESVSVRVSRPYEGQEAVTCVVPGHERAGRELIVNELRVSSSPLEFAYEGVCSYESTFDYVS